MTENQKNRLEQELRFLKESLEAEVISKEEYEKGKERVENRLQQLKDEPEPDISPEQEKEEIEIKELEEKPSKIIGADTEEEKEDEEGFKEIHVELPKGESPKEDKEIKESKEEIQEEPIEEPKEEETETKETQADSEDFLTKPDTTDQKPKEKTRRKKPALLFILIILMIIILSVNYCSNQAEQINETEETDSALEGEKEPVCASNEDCTQEGMIGICSNPSAEDAECDFRKPTEFKLTVINDKNCIICDTSRIIKTVKQLFPGVKVDLVDKNTDEGASLISTYDINILPYYIFESKVEEALKFDDFKSALENKEETYLLKATASGASYFFNRKSISNRLDLYVEPDSPPTTQMQENMVEVLDLFGKEIIYNENIVSDKDKRSLRGELAITGYPTILINNQIKVGGVQAANTIKDLFCKFNNHSNCITTLTTS